MVDKAEESIRENRAVKDYSKKIVLQKTQITPVKGSKTSGETSDSLQEDFGYESLIATPTKSPNSLLTESYELNQSEGICKT